ncbi:MAG TPA: DUF3579 domain-containing protein [Gammaproteobacteria bacterium]|nr:DUF3579 domain-containing protein [Gammaproteobacteria bacterium]
MAMGDEEVVVIRGVREDGNKFRPSDWIERISATLASFGRDQRLNYARAAQPCVVKGERCLVVERGLKESNPAAYEFIMGFARDNQLCVFEDRRSRQLEVSEDRRRSA